MPIGQSMLRLRAWRRANTDQVVEEPRAVDDPQAVDALQVVHERLTVEQDNELRRLNYMSQVGKLSERARLRMLELRIRDQRREIRPPREFG